MPQTNALFSAADLTAWLGQDVEDAKAELLERVVWGWLKPVLGLEDRPSTLPDEVFSWALELGAIAHENPSGMTGRQLGAEQQQFSLERRNQILDDAGSEAHTSVPAPVGCFPSARAYPDPAERC